MRRFAREVVVLASVLTLASCAPGGPLDSSESAEETPLALQGALLPDIVVRQSDLYTNYVDGTSQPGRRILRLSNGTANAGAGKLHLYGVTPANPDGSQTVMQRIFNAQGEYEDRAAGSFTYHPTHSHVHFDGWASYRVRQILPGDGVGDILAQGEKTSFCILDLGVYDSSLPAYVPGGEFHSCGSSTQGLSVGWIDVYGAGLSGQSIDVTDVPDGTYWLESVVDPDDHVLESDETNNAARIKVTIGAPPLAQDGFEPNDSASAAAARPAGAVQSPNLGPANPSRTIANLSIHTTTDVDWFRFYANHTGGAADFVGIDHVSANGDLDLDLYDAAGTLVATSDGLAVDAERISLEGRPEGWYYAVVRGRSGAINGYSLVVDPPANGAPSIQFSAPAAGNVDVVHALDVFTSTWTTADPEGDSTWVTLWLNKSPTLDGQQVLLETSLFTPGEEGFHIVNTSYVGEGTYWVYAEVTDGGTTVGQWSPGTVSFVPNPVCAHPVCQQGAKLNAPVCDPCAAQICAVDSYCCTTAWDSICVGEVASVCGQTCPSATSLDATVVARGGRLTITGAGFGAGTTVTVGEVAQTAVVDSPTQITLPALADATPVGATTVSIVTSLGSATLPVTVLDLLISEVDSDQTSTDTTEFVEISTGVPGATLTGYSVAFINGSNDKVYWSASLDAVTANAQGIALLGNPAVSPAPQATFPNSILQNGADAVAIYQGPPLAVGSLVTTASLIDALVYDTNDADDAGLLVLVSDGVQVNESTISRTLKRCGAGRRLGGKFVATTVPSPGVANAQTCN